ARAVRVQKKNAAPASSTQEIAIRAASGRPRWAKAARPCRRNPSAPVTSQAATAARAAVSNTRRPRRLPEISFSACIGPLCQSVAPGRIEIESVDARELRDLLQRLCRKRCPPLESMENYPLQQISQREVLELGKSLQHLE